MVLFKLVKNNNKNIEKAYGKVYARPVVTQTIGISELAEHLCSHNTGFSAGATQGLLTDMVKCIRELVLQGIAVKIDNLAIFSLGIKPKKGADSEDDFSVAKNVEGVRLLDINASLKNYDSFVKGAGDDSPTTPSGGGGSTSQGGGSTSQGSGSTTTGGGSGSSGGGSTPSGGGSSEGDGNVKEY